MGPEKLHHQFKSGNEAEPAFELESENRNLIATIQEKGSCFFPLDVLKLSLQWSFIGHCKVYFYFFKDKKLGQILPPFILFITLRVSDKKQWFSSLEHFLFQNFSTNSSQQSTENRASHRLRGPSHLGYPRLRYEKKSAQTTLWNLVWGHFWNGAVRISKNHIKGELANPLSQNSRN